MATDETPGTRRDSVCDLLLGLEHRERLRDLRLRNEEAQRLDVPGSVNPGVTCLRAWNVRIISPELTRSTRASATWMTTSVLAARGAAPGSR